MLWLAISSLMIVSSLAIVMLTEELMPVSVVWGVGMLLGVLALTRQPAEMRRELLRVMRLPLWLGLATLGGLLIMALSPNMPHPWRSHIGWFSLAVAFAYLAALCVTFLRGAREALRRNRRAQT